MRRRLNVVINYDQVACTCMIAVPKLQQCTIRIADGEELLAKSVRVHPKGIPTTLNTVAPSIGAPRVVRCGHVEVQRNMFWILL